MFRLLALLLVLTASGLYLFWSSVRPVTIEVPEIILDGNNDRSQARQIRSSYSESITKEETLIVQSDLEAFDGVSSSHLVISREDMLQFLKEGEAFFDYVDTCIDCRDTDQKVLQDDPELQTLVDASVEIVEVLNDTGHAPLIRSSKGSLERRFIGESSGEQLAKKLMDRSNNK